MYKSVLSTCKSAYHSVQFLWMPDMGIWSLGTEVIDGVRYHMGIQPGPSGVAPPPVFSSTEPSLQTQAISINNACLHPSNQLLGIHYPNKIATCSCRATRQRVVHNNEELVLTVFWLEWLKEKWPGHAVEYLVPILLTWCRSTGLDTENI